MQHYLLCPTSDAVYLLEPVKPVIGFKLFGYALFLCHLPHKPVHHLYFITSTILENIATDSKYFGQSAFFTPIIDDLKKEIDLPILRNLTRIASLHGLDVPEILYDKYLDLQWRCAGYDLLACVSGQEYYDKYDVLSSVVFGKTDLYLHPEEWQDFYDSYKILARFRISCKWVEWKKESIILPEDRANLRKFILEAKTIYKQMATLFSNQNRNGLQLGDFLIFRNYLIDELNMLVANQSNNNGGSWGFYGVNSSGDLLRTIISTYFASDFSWRDMQ